MSKLVETGDSELVSDSDRGCPVMLWQGDLLRSDGRQHYPYLAEQAWMSGCSVPSFVFLQFTPAPAARVCPSRLPR